MAELITRIGAGDAALLTRLVTPGAGGLMPARPDRVVVDAHTAQAHPEIANTARRAGLPMLIDPQTFYLQGKQYPGDPWAQLPFAEAVPLTVADLLDAGRASRLAAESLEFQLAHSATALTAPYVHVERAGDGWAEVQVHLYRQTRQYLDSQGINLPVIAPIATSWRLVGRTAWPQAMDRILIGLHDLAPTEVALAASKIDLGAHPDQRLADLFAAIGRLSRRWPVLAWQQGILGEACVVAGAHGYETGIGWNERCDLRAKMFSHRSAPAPASGFGARPVFIPAIGRSIPKRTALALLDESTFRPSVICPDPGCCPSGAHALTRDARAHAVNRRRTQLTALADTAHPRWAWQRLGRHASQGLRLARRINALAETPLGQTAGLTKIDLRALHAIQVTADVRRRTAPRRRAA